VAPPVSVIPGTSVGEAWKAIRHRSLTISTEEPVAQAVVAAIHAGDLESLRRLYSEPFGEKSQRPCSSTSTS
jgi:hypothetical protein